MNDEMNETPPEEAQDEAQPDVSVEEPALAEPESRFSALFDESLVLKPQGDMGPPVLGGWMVYDEKRAKNVEGPYLTETEANEQASKRAEWVGSLPEDDVNA